MTSSHAGEVDRPGILRHTLIDPHNLVYATILMIVGLDLVQYREEELGETITFSALVTRVTLPLLVVGLAHAFAGAIQIQVRERHSLTSRDYGNLALGLVPFASVAVLPIVVGLVVMAAGIKQSTSASISEYLGVISLAAWGYYGGWAAGKPMIGRIINAAIFGVIGTIIALLDIVAAH